jgi:hypothetical protein
MESFTVNLTAQAIKNCPKIMTYREFKKYIKPLPVEAAFYFKLPFKKILTKPLKKLNIQNLIIQLLFFRSTRGKKNNFSCC